MSRLTVASFDPSALKATPFGSGVASSRISVSGRALAVSHHRTAVVATDPQSVTAEEEACILLAKGLETAVRAQRHPGVEEEEPWSQIGAGQKNWNDGKDVPGLLRLRLKIESEPHLSFLPGSQTPGAEENDGGASVAQPAF